MQAGRSTIPLGGWAVGAQPHLLPEGFALRVPKGSDLVIQYHFHPTGKPEAEKSVVGLYFAKKPPERTLTRIQMPPAYSLFSGLDIPAGEKDFVIRDTYTLPVALVSNMRASFDLTIAAAAVLLIGITAILIVILERLVGFDRLIGQGLFRS